MNHLFILISSFWLFGASAVDVRTVIKVPNKVQAGTPFQASIQAKLENGNTTYCDSVRVFLETYSEDRRNYLYDAERMIKLPEKRLPLTTHSARLHCTPAIIMRPYYPGSGRLRLPPTDSLHSRHPRNRGSFRSTFCVDGSAVQHRRVLVRQQTRVQCV